MNNFKRINNLTGWVVFAVAVITYLLTIEPTTSFWDCGEFIASSYKLEVGHPPGNPVFQMLGRIFTLVADKEHAAMMINAMSALCSAFTILFLFWTITHLARRVMERGKEQLSMGTIVAIIGAGVVGSLVYTFSDTFWFSAVEAEVYAMSSLFTALVFWAILKWEEEADQKYANRWIVLIFFLMGLSVGVHLLNLLAIPAIALVYYFKKYKATFWGIVGTLVLSVVMLGFSMVLIPLIPRLAGYLDLFFVNSLGLPFNSGTVVFMIILMAALAFAVYYTQYRMRRILLNTIALSLLVFVIGFTAFGMVVIRSAANTPTNENQPDNAWSLLYYLNREQYGSAPILSGETFATPPIAIESRYNYVKLNGKYAKVEGMPSYKFDKRYTMTFPRMHSHQADHIAHYKQYMSGRGRVVEGSGEQMPTFRDNLSYFFDYQLGWMYWRYFMWNFAGRQNDIQGHGDSYHGNWESGIKFLDEARLGNIDQMPPYLAHHKSRNHYFLLPLLLGLLGFVYQLSKDSKNFFVVGVLFVLTGIAIVVYLNQTPFQPRERDYAYAGSFYAYAIWIGLGVLLVYDVFRNYVKLVAPASAAIASVLCLIIPIQMGAENWADHDRSNRYTARDMAYNYLMSCEKDALLFTIGDNDTFPLWYIQEVEGVRTDVRIVNTSLLGTDWYIDQMKYQMYDSPPVPFKLARESYLIGTNDYVQIVERVSEPQQVKDVMNFIADPRAKATLNSGEKVSYLPTRNFILPVNKENVLKNMFAKMSDTLQMPKMITMPGGQAQVTSAFEDSIPNQITFSIPKKTNSEKEKNGITKTELMILDLLANNDWKRPIYFVSLGGDSDLGFRDYLQYNGFCYKLTPFRNTSRDPQGMLDKDVMYDRLMNVYRWGNMNDPKVWMDWNNFLTIDVILNIRNMHSRVASAFNKAGDHKKAIDLLDRVMTIMPNEIFPYSVAMQQNDIAMLSVIEEYYVAGAPEKADQIVERFITEADENLAFYVNAKVGGVEESQVTLYCLQRLTQLCKQYQKENLAKKVEEKFQFYLQYMQM